MISPNQVKELNKAADILTAINNNIESDDLENIIINLNETIAKLYYGTNSDHYENKN